VENPQDVSRKFVKNTDVSAQIYRIVENDILSYIYYGGVNMAKTRWFASLIVLGILLVSLAFVQSTKALSTPPLTPIDQLGKLLFFDVNLSKNGNQSCATCHDPAVGYTGPVSEINAHGAVYPGSDPALFGNRKPPAAAYAGDSTLLRYDANSASWVGGMFWDGRATGAVLGDPLAEQAKGPFLNPLEMALASPEELCSKVKAGAYTALFDQVWGAGALDCAKAAAVYDQIGKSIAAYERSWEVNPYSSKFDLFWDKAKSKRLDVTKITTSNYTKYRNLGLTDTELYGLAMFNMPTYVNCASCHSLQPGSKGYPLFTDYSYDNLGMPKNLENPFYNYLAYNPEGSAWIDKGLGGYLETIQDASAAQQMGKMKVPTLRNVDKRPSTGFVKAYGHNGYFKSLEDIVRFYISRGMMGGMGGGGMGGGGMCGGRTFPAPEVNQNLSTLNHFPCRDQSYLVAFLKTLSDGYFQR
jgi:cytochrome c peroxidase